MSNLGQSAPSAPNSQVTFVRWNKLEQSSFLRVPNLFSLVWMQQHCTQVNLNTRLIWLTLRKISFFLTTTGPVAGEKEYGSSIIYLKKYNSLLFWVGSGWGVLIMLHYGRADELASSISISCWLFSLLQCIRHSSRVINDPNFLSQGQTSLH